ncbi:NDP-sugar epimerase, includes UDP-GlcNAc-inverting 4,6-dehydratase FlaA1 and capsular polysaccharide biosynthesis protein EpsC [Devosia lucknowensis]|uniref:NDP-sugar epimerase, includes UDP-GlcNAc-inverting 4,6-dehydratase FlaA1 and capsular polysaccharide biosynthesis protein EpsC n=1 Tax=Devosia lucknowensis TaxID=1096929 RepID=A0A1Y6G5U7_9HYPH|nr:nucleoside-diphosphate sugar epimerase/dehydratase [Devosia lucknowensis]SMQ85532.1 NDP-sugar epimerase, includes UDP-GlcNAc-inverting 4,6-dehydratase FlaA1 and capsular polysaccharide biosynthesis protein EpsC [Devosia lucknowensis]
MIDRFRTWVLGLPRRGKQAILLSFDFIALSCALWASFCLRYDAWYLPNSLDQWIVIILAPVVTIPVFIRMGLYRAIVRYLPERAMWTILRAMVIATVTWVVLVFLSQLAGRLVVPRSVPLIYLGLGTFIIAGSRFAAKWTFLPQFDRTLATQTAAIIYGAGDAGIQLAHSLRSTHMVVAFVDDNPALHRRELAGVKVYSPGALGELIEEHGVKDVILSIPSLTAQRRKEIVASVSKHGVKIRALPSIVDLVTGKYLVSQIKEIDIIELLGRSSVPPDAELIKHMIVGRSIMVTGAGGSIGSELCRKIASWSPRCLVLFEANEFALYQIEQELSELQDLVIIPVLGSVIDRERVNKVLAQHDIKVVFHAAAHKHVPLVEANALEGIKNNVFGTAAVAEAAYAHGVENFVLISTDKAVRPTNVMGATKRWAELIVGSIAMRAKGEETGQRFCAVRFGNVLGSNGSVVPLFKQQIAAGGPVTLTDAAMTRYFMSIQEAAELIVQAGALSKGGDVFLLDMGEPMLISELAENMIRLAGLSVRNEANPHGDIEIVVTGKRPGEKLYEELFYDSSDAEITKHAKIMRAPSRARSVSIADLLADLQLIIERHDEQAARQLLFEAVEKSG